MSILDTKGAERTSDTKHVAPGCASGRMGAPGEGMSAMKGSQFGPKSRILDVGFSSSGIVLSLTL